jgi:lysophospholipase L1-like esterase
VFFFQEALFRFFFPLPEIENFDRVNYSRINLDGSGSIHNRNINRTWSSLPDTQYVFKHEMNKYAFRDHEWYINKPPNKQRIVFIGDSFVEGVMAEQKETIPEAFKNSGSQNNIEVFNAGMIGCGLDSYMQLVADFVPVFKPDVVFLCIYANDLGKHKPLIPDYYLEPVYYNFYVPRLVELYRQSTTNGNVPFRWRTNTDAYIMPVPNPQNPWTTMEDSLTQHVKPWVVSEMKNASLNPFLTNSLAKEERYLKEKPLIGETLPFINYTCKQQSTELVIVYIPSRNQVSDYYLQFERQYCLSCPDYLCLNTPEYQLHQEVIKTQCKKLGLPFIDLSPLIKSEESKGNHLYWNYDQHMRAKGYQFVGEYIRKTWDSYN